MRRRISTYLVWVYSALTFLAFLTILSTSLTFDKIAPGIGLMWLIFLVYRCGETFFTKRDRGYALQSNELQKIDNILLGSNSIMFLIALNMVIFSIAIARFYTGQTPISVLRSLDKGVSLYKSYQLYYTINKLGTMSSLKYPYIIMNFLMNFLVIYSYIGITLCQKTKPNSTQYFTLLASAAAYLYYGVARGTNFEVFLFGLLNIYIFMSKSASSNGMRQVHRTRNFVAYFLGIMALLIASGIVFIVVTNQRMITSNHYSISREVFFDSTRPISRIFPQIGLIITRLSQYFTWGLYYTSVFLNDIVFDSSSSFFISLIPGGLQTIDTRSVYDQVAGLIDPSINWMPDIVRGYEQYGLLGIISIVLGLSFVAVKNTRQGDVVGHIVTYYVLMQMFSYPIGNFIMVLSANRLIVMVLTVLTLLRWIVNRKGYCLVRDRNACA